MSLKIRFRFDGRCTRHHRYNPSAMDIHLTGSVKDVSLCTSFLYTRIAKRRAYDANLIVVRASSDRDEQQAIDVQPSSETGAES
jgi:hypothetical protein